jgi:hypothetical protein
LAEGAAHAAVGVLADEPGDAGAQAVLGADGVADEADGGLVVVGEVAGGQVGEQMPQRLDVAQEGHEQGADPRLERARTGGRGEGGHEGMAVGFGARGHPDRGGARGLLGGCDRHWLEC